jgi:ribosomal protein L37AE/L43A
MEQKRNKILCPYCKEVENHFTRVVNQSSFVDITNCQKCDKLFLIQGDAYWEYTTKKIEGEE